MTTDSTTRSTDLPESPGFWRAFRYWLLLGCISFGGPAGQIALMHQELVDRRRWISDGRFVHALNYCMLLPGPEAQQLATYIGWLLHGTRGGIVAGALFVLPSLLLLIVLSWLYVSYGHIDWVSSIFAGLKPAVVAIVFAAAWRIGKRTLKNRWLLAIAVLAFLAEVIWAVPFPLLVLLAALIGVAGARVAPAVFRAGAGHPAAAASSGPYLIDDGGLLAAHMHFRWSRLLIVTAIGIGLWATTIGVLFALGGRDATLSQMGWFFTKAAMLTFGGAYAVLPYVYDGAVDHYQWLTAAQMLDGLALGETTPGPLIMIVAFVGFLGGWGDATGVQPPLLMAIAGALVATFFTFLPSFVFILAGAPLVETTHGEIRVTAPLTAISAAVVGVILALAVMLGMHVFLPAGGGGPANLLAVLICAVALAALVRWQVGVVPLLFACALVGLMAGM
jgi:chromate transporter